MFQPMTKRPYGSAVSTSSPSAKPMGITAPPQPTGPNPQKPRG